MQVPLPARRFIEKVETEPVEVTPEMAGPYKYREVKKRLSKYDERFEFRDGRGKGSERMIYHPDIKGRPESIPVKHHGNNTELRKGVIGDIINRFKLPKGVL